MKKNYMDSKELKENLRKKLDELETATGHAFADYKISHKTKTILKDLDDFAVNWKDSKRFFKFANTISSDIKQSLKFSDSFVKKEVTDVKDASKSKVVKYLSECKDTDIPTDLKELGSLRDTDKGKCLKKLQDYFKEYELKKGQNRDVCNFIREKYLADVAYYEGKAGDCLQADCNAIEQNQLFKDSSLIDDVLDKVNTLKDNYKNIDNTITVMRADVVKSNRPEDVKTQLKEFLDRCQEFLKNLFNEKGLIKQTRDDAKAQFTILKNVDIMTPGLLNKMQANMERELSKESAGIRLLIEEKFSYDEINKALSDKKDTGNKLTYSHNKFEINRKLLKQIFNGGNQYLKNDISNALEAGKEAMKNLNKGIEGKFKNGDTPKDEQAVETEVKSLNDQFSVAMERYANNNHFEYLKNVVNTNSEAKKEDKDEEVEKFKNAIKAAYKMASYDAALNECNDSLKEIFDKLEKMKKEKNGIFFDFSQFFYGAYGAMVGSGLPLLLGAYAVEVGAMAVTPLMILCGIVFFSEVLTCVAMGVDVNKAKGKFKDFENENKNENTENEKPANA